MKQYWTRKTTKTFNRTGHKKSTFIYSYSTNSLWLWFCCYRISMALFAQNNPSIARFIKSPYSPHTNKPPLKEKLENKRRWVERLKWFRSRNSLTRKTQTKNNFSILFFQFGTALVAVASPAPNTILKHSSLMKHGLFSSFFLNIVATFRALFIDREGVENNCSRISLINVHELFVGMIQFYVQFKSYKLYVQWWFNGMTRCVAHAANFLHIKWFIVLD